MDNQRKKPEVRGGKFISLKPGESFRTREGVVITNPSINVIKVNIKNAEQLSCQGLQEVQNEQRKENK